MTFKKRNQHSHRGGPRQQRQTSQPSSEGHWIFGRNPAKEILNWDSGRIIEAYTSSGVKADNRAADMLERLRSEGVPIHKTDFDSITKLVGSDGHQGFALRLKERKAIELDSVISEYSDRHSCLLLIDGVQDPQNLGTILRAAECLGVDAVVWSRNRTVGITPVVSKASAGASEIVPIVVVGNLLQTIERLKKADYWTVGAVADPSAVALNKFEFPKKTAIIMGSEGAGVQKAIEDALDFKVYIPMHGRLDSLNVSQATSVFLYAWASQGRG